MRLNKNVLNRSFSHIYVEKEARSYSKSQEILKRFPNAQVVEIDDYKEVFSKGNQNFYLQKRVPKLILAVKKENYIYEGAKVCESFGNENFYYTSSILNCIYDCEYCYLQGVYTSGNIVIFVNIEDIFEEIEKILKEKSMYICISYDTDLMALEEVTGFVKAWYEFAQKHENLKIELRTKSSSIKVFENLKINKNFIIAWTLSPEEFAEKYEIGSVSFEKRLQSAKELVDKGWTVRVCFDPMIRIDSFQESYGKMVEQTFSVLSGDKILDVSIGVFRISKEYMKRMKKNRVNSLVLNYPFSCYDGVYTYSKEENEEMIEFMRREILKYVPEEKLFV